MGRETDIPQDLPGDMVHEPPLEPGPGIQGMLGVDETAGIRPVPLESETTDLENLYRMYCRELGRLAFLLTSNQADAEDVVVDVFVTIAERYDVRTLDNPLAFLRAAVVNRSRSVLRHRIVVDKYTPKQPPDAPSAEQGAMEQLERQEVVAALRQLPPRQREVIILRYYLDLSEAEIAQTMGVRPGSVKGHSSRAIATLRRILTLGGIGP